MSLQLSQIQRCAVLGAGTMGHGIAQIAAQSGFEVVLYDVTREAAEKGLARIRGNLETGVAKGKVAAEARDAALARLSAVDTLAALEGAQWVVEAVPEDLELKQKLLGELAKLLGPEALLASNTSSLSLTEIAAGMPQPGARHRDALLQPAPSDEAAGAGARGAVEPGDAWRWRARSGRSWARTSS